jgi:hypothetical protein
MGRKKKKNKRKKSGKTSTTGAPASAARAAPAADTAPAGPAVPEPHTPAKMTETETKGGGVTIELLHDDGQNTVLHSAELRHKDGAFHVSPLSDQLDTLVGANEEDVAELQDLLSVDKRTALYYYEISHGDVSQALSKYFERAGQGPPSTWRSNTNTINGGTETKTKIKTETISTSMLDSPRLRNRPSKLNLTGEEGADGMPMTISFRVKAADAKNNAAGKDANENKDEEGYSSDSSGVGLITPRHANRPPPLFDAGDHGGGIDPLPSCSSESAIRESTSFRQSSPPNENRFVDHIEDEIDGIHYVEEYDEDDFNAEDSDDHDHDDDPDEYSSDSSGVGLITPRHANRPPPLFHDGEDDDDDDHHQYCDPLPSIRSQTDMIKHVPSFHPAITPAALVHQNLQKTLDATQGIISKAASSTTDREAKLKQAYRDATTESERLSNLVLRQMEHLEESERERNEMAEALAGYEFNAQQAQEDRAIALEKMVQMETEEIKQKYQEQLKNEQLQAEITSRKNLEMQLNEALQKIVQQNEMKLEEVDDTNQIITAADLIASVDAAEAAFADGALVVKLKNDNRELQELVQSMESQMLQLYQENQTNIDAGSTTELQVMELYEENQQRQSKLTEYEGIMTSQAEHSQEQMKMIRVLRKRTQLLTSQVAFEKSMRERPPTRTRQQAMLREQYMQQAAKVERYKQQHQLDTARRRQERAWERR